MENKKIISFAGVKREDVVYYISKLLATFDEPVLVVDNSEQQGVFRSVHHRDEDGEIYVKNIAFIHNIAYSERMVDVFQYTIVYHGMEIDQTWWDHSDERFLFTNYDRFDVDDIRDMLRNVDIGYMGLIFTDKVTDKITERYLVEKLELPKGVLDDAIEIPREDSIEAARIAFQYNKIGKVNRLPQAMKRPLTTIFNRIAPEDKKRKMDKVFSKAD